MINRRLALASGLAAATALGTGASARPRLDPRLVALIDGPQRSAANKVRDPARHPAESLAFWGVRPGMVLADIDPAGGYWTEILAPYVNHSGGRYIGGMAGGTPAADARRAAFAAKYPEAVYGPIGFADFGAAVGFVAPPASLDMVLYCRFIHDLMSTPGALDRALGGMYAALKPGGILAIEEHRADPRPMIDNARDGYVSTGYVIAEAKKAGFVLAASSEINANPKDTKDHPFGVWTLPPTRRSAPQGQPPNPAFDHTKYDAIGESDRMTLKFTKPI